MDDRRPNFITAIARMTGLSGSETISPISTPFSRFNIIPECPGQTDKRTYGIAISVSSAALCRSYCWCWIAV